jgi:hypothetical protein
MTSEIAVSAVTLRGETCNFTDITGVRTLKTKGGADLVNIAEGLHEQLLKFTEILNDLTERVEKIEKDGGGGAGTPGAQGPPGPTSIGRDGVDGADGKDGLSITGPRGPRGKSASEFRDLSDIDLTGLTDGAILVFRGKKWVVEAPDDDEEE